MTSASSLQYTDPAAYDLIYSWYDVDLAFYLDQARSARGPVLEVGCGTGRILIPTLAAGVDIEGFDHEPRMLERLKSKAAAQNLEPRVHVADMRDFTMPRKYALITIPFRAFMHLMTTDDQIRALRCMREHLQPGGTLVYNLFYPGFRYIIENDGRRGHERDLTDPERGTVSIWSTPHYDRVNQTLTSEREVIFTNSGETQRYGFTLRWTYRFEMELLLRAAGFQRFQVWGGFDHRPLEHETDEMVWTAWRD